MRSRYSKLLIPVPRLPSGGVHSSLPERPAIRAVLPRLPLAWPLLPVLLPLLALALRRGGPAPTDSLPDTAPDRAARRAFVTGMAILFAGSLAGACEMDRGWPFACYPPFAWISGPYRHVLRITTTNAKGEQRPVDETALTKQLGPQWKAQLFGLVLLTPEQELRSARLLAMWHLYQRLDPKLRAVVRVQFDELLVRIDPDAPAEQLERRLLSADAR